MPHHAPAAVAARLDCRRHLLAGPLHSPPLVVAGDLLHDLPASVLLKDDAAADVVQQRVGPEQPADEPFERGPAAVVGPPGGEAARARRRPHAGEQPVGAHGQDVGHHEVRQLLAVADELGVGRVQVGLRSVGSLNSMTTSGSPLTKSTRSVRSVRPSTVFSVSCRTTRKSFACGSSNPSRRCGASGFRRFPDRCT